MATSTNFPTLSASAIPDSSAFQVSYEDPAMRLDMEGGYVISRARHTRTPRRTWKVTYKMLSNADRALLETLWDTVRGGSATFNWTNPQNSTSYEVRFKEQLSFNYTGRGTNQRWDCSFTLEQA